MWSIAPNCPRSVLLMMASAPCGVDGLPLPGPAPDNHHIPAGDAGHEQRRNHEAHLRQLTGQIKKRLDYFEKLLARMDALGFSTSRMATTGL
ncbi:MAG TPA: hypothetical protein VFE62_19215 [Gemmataceae bacterium]|nr:hypothetical protein [Gemmataceae bacterium]